MKKLLISLVLMLAVFASLSAVITYGTVTSKTSGKFITYTGLTTVVVADTTNPYILSPVFSAGSVLSNKGIMISGVVVADLKHSTAPITAVALVLPVLQVSYDGTNFVDLLSLGTFIGTGGTAGTAYVVPASLVGYLAPYYRVKWMAYASTGIAITHDLYGTIRTLITTIP